MFYFVFFRDYQKTDYYHFLQAYPLKPEAPTMFENMVPYLSTVKKKKSSNEFNVEI